MVIYSLSSLLAIYITISPVLHLSSKIFMMYFRTALSIFAILVSSVLAIQLAPNSGIAALYVDKPTHNTTQTGRIYYQSPDGSIHECITASRVPALCVSDSVIQSGTGGQFPAYIGSPIAATQWDDFNQVYIFFCRPINSLFQPRTWRKEKI